MTAADSRSIYGPLAAPIAVLLWLYLVAIAVLIGAAVNAAFDTVFPQMTTTNARKELVARLRSRIGRSDPDPVADRKTWKTWKTETVANVNLPTPVVIAGGALCLLGGYLIGSWPVPTPRTGTGEVESYDSRTRELCLTGSAVSEQEGADDEGLLCGAWQRSPGSATPHPGDSFLFVTKRNCAGPVE